MFDLCEDVIFFRFVFPSNGDVFRFFQYRVQCFSSVSNWWEMWSSRVFPLYSHNFKLELTTVFFYREKERTELKSKIEELEAFKSKYEEEKQQKEVSSNRCIMYINVKYFLITYINLEFLTFQCCKKFYILKIQVVQ